MSAIFLLHNLYNSFWDRYARLIFFLFPFLLNASDVFFLIFPDDGMGNL